MIENSPLSPPSPTINALACPTPLPHEARIVMGHGSGGKMSHDLIRQVFLPPFDNPALNAGNDAALVIPDSRTRLAVSTDSHVVRPLFFPGGDIGRLAVCGTVNDLAMLGATPRYLTAGFILEEGLAMELLARVVDSMRSAAAEAGVQIVAGDTKVVERGKADGLYVNTAGVGTLREGVDIGGANARPGDAVLISGTVGDHGIAVLAARGDLGFETGLQSDVAPLNGMVDALLDAGIQIRVLRDPTRGGVATTLNEIARQSGVGITIYENRIPMQLAVQAACEMLGFDPLYIANEGKLLAIVAQEDAESALEIMQANCYGANAAIIGAVHPPTRLRSGRVLMKTVIGSTRIVDVLAGEMLPRIC
ncbi:MAG: hydrogenase expression/formation protein HypE [Anaerolineales bacterium]